MKNGLSKEEEKNKIRERYKGGNIENMQLIPAVQKESIIYDDSPKRVAVYVRVSTGDPRQTSSYENQKNYYTDSVSKHPNWDLVEIYADEGISGTSLKHRDAFLRMISDCEKGKIDLIITKSVSRFARNIEDCIHYVRHLRRLSSPVSIYFETDAIDSADIEAESRLTFSSYLAQEESSIKSKSMDISLDMRFSRGILLTPELLGYDQDEDGHLVINEEEAKTVRLIFFLYLYGWSCQQIAEKLQSLGRKTKIKREKWSASSVRQILCNERHCGDVLARKTFTPDFLTHQHKRNVNQRNKYLWKDDHEAIISRDDFIAVQHMMQNAKYKSKYANKSFLPELQSITEGLLKGYVIVHPNWTGFSVDDYIKASQLALTKDVEKTDQNTYTAKNGEFDFRGYEIVRSQFIDSQQKLSLTFEEKALAFSINAIRKIPDYEYVELLVYPQNKELAVRGCKKDSKYALKWCKKTTGKLQPRQIAGSSFVPLMYDMFKWNDSCKYKFNGVYHETKNGGVIIFDLSEPEVFIPYGNITSTSKDELASSYGSTKKNVRAYPQNWAETFGDEYYTQLTFQPFSEVNTAKVNQQDKSEIYSNIEPLNVTDERTLHGNITSLINDMEEKANNG